MAFIRRKRVHKKTKDGERRNYFYYYRVENYRTADSKLPKQRVLAYLGDASTARDRLAEEKENWSEREVLQLQKFLESEQKTSTSPPAPAPEQPGKAPPSKKSTHQRLLSSESNEWYTPPEFIELARSVMGAIDCDPASNATAQQWIKATVWYGQQDDGFVKEWHGRLWLNPPYGVRGKGNHGAGAWIKRAIAQFDAGITQQAILLVRGDSAGIRELRRRFPCCEPDQRIAFIRADGTPSDRPVPGCRFFYLGPRVAAFEQVFSAVGVVMHPSLPQPITTPGKSLEAVEGWLPGDTFTHQGKSFEVVGRGNRYLKLRDQGGAIARWDTQEQVLWYDAAQPAAPRLAQKLAARRQAG
jgi:hypothetical protein